MSIIGVACAAAVGRPGTPTGITAEGPALKGATNLVIGPVDHRGDLFAGGIAEHFYSEARVVIERCSLVQLPHIAIEAGKA